MIHLLKKQIDQLLELRVDTSISRHWTKQEKIDYLQCLTKIYAKHGNEKYQTLIMNFSSLADELLMKRAASLFRLNSSRFVSVITACFFVMMSLLSFAFVLEPYAVHPSQKEDSFSLSDTGYIIKNNNGNYTFYMDNQKVGTIENPDSEDFKNFPIYDRQGNKLR